jgi:peptide/nickel transport system ATP-binding protein
LTQGEAGEGPTERMERQLALLFITHDMAVVEYLSDRMLVMRDGRMEEIGPTAEVIARPRAEYTRRLLAAVPRVGAHLSPAARAT